MPKEAYKSKHTKETPTNCLCSMHCCPSTILQSLAMTWLFFFLVFIMNANSHEVKNEGNKVISVGVIMDANSRVGKEQRVAMEIAAQTYNNTSKNYKLSLHFHNSTMDPISDTNLAEEMIRMQKVQVILGFHRWPEAALIAEIGSRFQVPIISYAEPSITPPLMSIRWPFLVRMANSGRAYVKCIVDIVKAYGWERVIAIYEDDAYGGEQGMLALLSEALQDANSMIEYNFILPPISSLHDPRGLVQDELLKLMNTQQSRVFIVLQSSLEMVIHLFREASNIGLVDKESVWIIPESITNLIDSINKSSISYMEGAIGIKNYYSEENNKYQDFEAQFQRTFWPRSPEEDNRKPGFFALQAYDSISIVSQALDRMSNGKSSTNTLLREIQSSNFSGLSGHIEFEDGKLLQNPILRVVNVVGKSYKELCFWTQQHGFSTSFHATRQDGGNGNHVSECFNAVLWPGNLQRTPKGWKMPTKQKPMQIAVPGRTTFSRFVKVDYAKNQNLDKYDGFCIKIFEQVHKILGYDLPYEFHAINCTYPDLVQLVYNKSYDAVVGDITILEERLPYVDFTVPYAESGLSMLVPAKSDESAWLFTKPFTWQLWTVTGAILIYTMLVVWLLEKEPNPEFHGNWKNQISTALWFTISSLFFAHREKVYRKLTRVVMVSWLFLVLILNSSYTASLSSMLTVKQLQPNVTDIEWLKKNNMKIGCDGDSFVRNYLEDVEKFKPENIINIISEDRYIDAFANGSIVAAFLELPYEKVFISEYCDGYTASTPRTRFGGLGFMFQKGSPVTRDVSRAILHLSENGELKKLEEEWLLSASQKCSNMTSNGTESLSLRSLWILFVISGATSTICMLLSAMPWQKLCLQSQELAPEHNGTTSDESIWRRVITLAMQIHNKKVNNSSDHSSSFGRDNHLRDNDSTEQQHHHQPVNGILMQHFPPPPEEEAKISDLPHH
ncbi:hypothetical protein HN51_057902 [Arachis hypogaea]|uniref:Glutamate receptor n=1 Tax=Arachis hypogaea TaxID=3818 RepID=A0A444WYS7_ARAHY|nr:glutamate receptor 2.7 isoform X1 [Arachis hypogaea]QHN81029.1 Glutamate receptor 2 [Arachis hypogaea]RYQ82555.1 hypothetical protein Ahy_B10g101142 isoform B [Arachis hypogaea]